MNILAKYGEVAVFSAANWSPKRTELPQIARWVHCNVEQQRSGRENLLRRLWWLFQHQHPDCDWPYSELAAEKLRQLMQTFKPDLVILEQVWLYRYLAIVKQFPCRIILDQHNVEAHLFAQSLSQEKQLALKAKKSVNALPSQNHRTRLLSASRSDLDLQRQRQRIISAMLRQSRSNHHWSPTV